MKESLNVIVAGVTGYIGIELVKILLKHPKVNIKNICAKKSIGRSLYNFDPFFRRKKLPKISNIKNINFNNIDVLFTALPNGEAQKIANKLNSQVKLIDLSADFRLQDANNYKKWYNLRHRAQNLIKDSIYCIPELSRKNIRKFKIIACPGCYPTSIQIPLVPVIKDNLININNIIVDSKSGYSGAGRNIHKKFANKNLYESLSAYGVGFHRHNSEIEQEIKNFTKKKVNFTFTPHLTPMVRGILSSIYIDVNKGFTFISIYNELKKFYLKKLFIKIKKPDTFLSTNDVINTNNCHISICKTKYKNKYIILSVIDNLIKGGAGQAIQNMNIKFNFAQSKGLI